MPVVASARHQAWVRVPPPKRPKASKKSQKNILCGPLAYLSCRPADAIERTLALKRPCHPFEIPDFPRSHGHRAVSAPQSLPHDDYYEDSEREEDDADDGGDVIEPPRPPPPPTASSHRPRSSKSHSTPRAVSSQFQSPIFQSRQPTQPRNAYSNRLHSSNNRPVSSSWSNATKPLDLG